MLHTILCDTLGIEHPIINAPMGDRAASAELASAVSAAGGFGMIGGSDSQGRLDQGDWLRDQIRTTRERTDRPFGVGFILSFFAAIPGQEDLLQVALQEQVPAVALSFGDPTPYVTAIHTAGAKALVQVQTVAQATRAARAGADVIAAQGTDGGGHVGAIGTMSLTPAIVDAVPGVPVVAAGGIVDGRGLAAALLLGAEGVWLGTRFVASDEWAGEGWRKAGVVEAGTDDTVRTLSYDLAWEEPFPDGIAIRVVRDAFTDAWHGRDDEVVANRTQLQEVLRKARTAGEPVGAVLAGSGVGLVDAVEQAGEIVQRIVAEAESLLRGRPSQVLR